MFPAVLSHILSEGPHVRVGPDRYDPSLYSNTPMAPELSHCPSQKSSSTLAVGQDAPADARAPTDNKEVGVARKENAVLLQDKKQFQWRKGDRGELPPPDELILRTLLQVQQVPLSVHQLRTTWPSSPCLSINSRLLTSCVPACPSTPDHLAPLPCSAH